MRSGLLALVLLAAVAGSSAQHVVVRFDTQPRIQRFITLNSDGGVIYHQQTLPTVDDMINWMDRHLSVVEGVLSTVFGVYPCPYQQQVWDPVMLLSARQAFLNQLEDEAYYYDEQYYEQYSTEQGASVSNQPEFITAGSLANTGFLQRVVDDFFGAEDNEQDLTQPLMPAMLMSMPSTTSDAASMEPWSTGHPVERELVADGTWSAIPAGVEDVYQVYYDQVEEDAEVAWAFATWDFAVFIALASACVFVWAAMFNTCCQLSRCVQSKRSAEEQRRQQFIDDGAPAELLEPLCANDYTEPARVVAARNPAFARA